MARHPRGEDAIERAQVLLAPKVPNLDFSSRVPR